MARRCGCSGSACNCLVEGGTGADVAGTGTAQDPYVVSSHLQANDTATVDLSLSGAGKGGDPYTLTADAHVKVEELENYSGVPPTNGQVLGFDGATNLWHPQPAATALPGAINTGSCLVGDGSSGDPLNLRLSGNGEMICGPDGLEAPYAPVPVTSQADRDAITPRYDGLKVERLDLAGRIERWNGSRWVYHSGAVPLVYEHWRDSVNREAETPLVGAVVPILVMQIVLPADAPPGTYRVEADYGLGASGAAALYLDLRWDSSSLTNIVRQDIAAGRNYNHFIGTPVVHPGGTATIQAYVQNNTVSLASLVIYNGSSKLVVTYLGTEYFPSFTGEAWDTGKWDTAKWSTA